MNKIKYILISILMSFLMISDSYCFSPYNRSITVIIPYSPGGNIDNLYRNLEKYAMSKGIKLINEYKAGADGVIGLNELTKKPKDGYTIALSSAASLAQFKISKPDESLIIISSIADAIGAFVVNSQNSIKTIDELCQSMNSSDIKFGYGAPGQLLLLNELFSNCKVSKTPLLVPYKGGSAVVTDLIGNQIDAARVPLVLVNQHVNIGKLKLLAITRRQMKEYSVPTIESIFPYWKELDAIGILAPNNTDPESIKFWREFLKSWKEDENSLKQFKDHFFVELSVGLEEFNNIVNINQTELLRLKNE